MKRVRSKRILGNLTLVVLSLAISFFLAEILLRHVFPIDTGTSHQHRIPHPVFGWVLEPNASYLNRMPEATVRVTYNSKGWRDVEHSLENRHGAFRILVLGDSFMEAFSSVELNDTFHKRIEQFARDKGIDVEDINLGVGGYGTLQEYLVFREVGVLYKPNLVLLGFYIGNDVRNNSIELESI
ncbi:MAG: SGNH/GDSL hydrolase family protein, partial [Planctomycetota bacterium]